jgi:hypothetical protein
MPQVSLTDYRATKEAAERRQRLAAALREQATSPIQIQSYNGIQAPIPVTEVLVKALQGYLGGRQEKKAEKDLAEGRATARREAMEFFPRLKQETPQDRFIAPPNFQPEQTGIIDRLKQAGQQFMPQQPQPMAAPPPQMQPPPMSAPQQPMPQGPEAMPQMSDMRQIPAELQNRARSPEEQQQMLMDATMSGNPYLESIAPKMYADMEASMQAQDDRERKIQAIMGLDATDEQKQQMYSAMELGDNPAFKNAIRPPVPIQSPEGVIGLVAQKVANGEPLSEGEKQIWQMYTARQRKQAYIAPRGGDGPRPGNKEKEPVDPVEVELRRRGLL